jgi:hypothetical protein
MWTCLLETDFIQVLNKEADAFIEQERTFFYSIVDFVYEIVQGKVPLHKNVEKECLAATYISDHNALIKTPQRQEKVSLYSTMPLEMALLVQNRICGKFGEKAAVKVVIDQQYLKIEYDERLVAEVRAVPEFEKIMEAPMVREMKSIPVIFELIRLLRRAHLPEYIDEWSCIPPLLEPLLKMMISSTKHLASLPQDAAEPIKQSKQSDGRKVADSILDAIHSQEYLVLDPSDFPLQIVSKNDDEYDIAKLKPIFNQHKRGLISAEIQVKLPHDLRFTKFALMAVDGKKEEHVADILYNARYDIIPFKEASGSSKFKRPGPIPLCRYYCINLLTELGGGARPDRIQHYMHKLQELLPTISVVEKKMFFGVYESDFLFFKLKAMKVESKNIFFCEL